MKKSRRDLLKGIFVTSALVPFAGCATLDRWFMGESDDEDDSVLIIGAGLAGLSAAFQLKKNGVPFRVFEGSSRVGGRVWTIRDLNVSSQYGDLGGDKIEPEHTAIQAIARELKVSLDEITTKESAAWFGQGSFLSPKEWKKEAAALVALFRKVRAEAYGSTAPLLSFQNKEQFPKAVLLDRMSVAGLLDRLQMQMRPWMKPFLEQVVRSEWGVEPSQISALHLIHWMRDSFRPFGKKYLRISGGTSVLTQALFDRISGVIPDRFVRFDHKLVEIRQNETNWSLFFRSPEGRQEIRGRKIICTLPPHLLRQVRGWEQIPISEQKKKLIAQQEMGSHSKILLSFQDRFWAGNPVLGAGGTWYTDFETSSISQAGESGVQGVTDLHGVLQSQLGGEAGAKAGPHSASRMLKDLEKIENRSLPYENIYYVQNWKLFPWAKGSRSYLKPGQFQQFDSSPQSGSWALAGDSQTLNFLGSMNGAVLTGIDAAHRFLKTSG